MCNDLSQSTRRWAEHVRSQCARINFRKDCLQCGFRAREEELSGHFLTKVVLRGHDVDVVQMCEEVLVREVVLLRAAQRGHTSVSLLANMSLLDAHAPPCHI